MYLGRVVESAPTAELFARPNHPYTAGAASPRCRASTRAAARYVPIQRRNPLAARAAARAAISIRAARRPSTRCRVEAPRAARDRAGPPLRLPPERSARHEPAFTHHPRPTGDRVPLVLDSPHSGTDYPEDFRAARARASCCARPRTASSTSSTAPRPRSAPRSSRRASRAATSIPTARSLDIDARCSTRRGPGPRDPARKTKLGIGLIWRVARYGRADLRAQALVDEVKRPHRALPPALPARGEGRAGRGPRALRRGLAPQLPFDAAR